MKGARGMLGVKGKELIVFSFQSPFEGGQGDVRKGARGMSGVRSKG